MVADIQGLQRKLVDVLCFLNITSAVAHKIVLIPNSFTLFSMYGISSNKRPWRLLMKLLGAALIREWR